MPILCQGADSRSVERPIPFCMERENRVEVHGTPTSASGPWTTTNPSSPFAEKPASSQNARGLPPKYRIWFRIPDDSFGKRCVERKEAGRRPKKERRPGKASSPYPGPRRCWRPPSFAAAASLAIPPTQASTLVGGSGRGSVALRRGRPRSEVLASASPIGRRKSVTSRLSSRLACRTRGSNNPTAASQIVSLGTSSSERRPRRQPAVHQGPSRCQCALVSRRRRSS